MLNGLLEYVVTLIVYKIKVPPWCAVLREAWRTLLLQMYDFFLIRQNFLLSPTLNDTATYTRSLCPAANTSNAAASSPKPARYQGPKIQPPSTLRKGWTPIDYSSSALDCDRILAHQSETCPALCISQVLQPRIEST